MGTQHRLGPQPATVKSVAGAGASAETDLKRELRMATSDCREDEGEFLCEMFGEEGRFVEFVNQTGRAVRLVSRLEVVAMPSQAWTSRLPLPAATRHTWRFLGHDVAFPLFPMPGTAGQDYFRQGGRGP